MSIRLLTFTDYEQQVVASPEYEHQVVVSHRIQASGWQSRIWASGCWQSRIWASGCRQSRIWASGCRQSRIWASGCWQSQKMSIRLLTVQNMSIRSNSDIHVPRSLLHKLISLWNQQLKILSKWSDISKRSTWFKVIRSWVFRLTSPIIMSWGKPYMSGSIHCKHSSTDPNIFHSKYG